MDVSVYQLTTSPLEKSLPRLLEKVYQGGLRAVIYTNEDHRVEELNKVLWTYTTKFFLPHGTQKDGFADQQPIWLTNRLENPNNASVLVLCDGAATQDFDGFSRCLDLFDGNDDDAKSAARQRVRAYKSAGHNVSFWQQTAKGTWEKMGQ